MSSCSSCHFVPKDENKPCAQDQNRKQAEHWVEINLLMYLEGMH